ncbi:acyltransferase [Tichowtungia aerotolerans]|uniref:Acyltransferase n=1 Tax=Tichowtungia aerotolerans TaxID=2697043 RepID=A0A6P1M926_9BACT|nr:acyltransferase [Tichowtungia aerotolerans]QHI68086.1 acyltransferase [Tichowtungia aerotolerans]
MIQKLADKSAKLKWSKYHLCACLTAWLHDGQFLMGKECRLQVPLKVNGKGRTKIENQVRLGYHLAPKTGRGEILIQARTPESEIIIGKGTALSNNIALISCSKISIGTNCNIGDQVSIYDTDFHEISPETRNNSAGETLPIKIGMNVWIGSRVIILKGVDIGDHCVIAAGSIVTKSIPDRSLAAGIPAKIIRTI